MLISAQSMNCGFTISSFLQKYEYGNVRKMHNMAYFG